MELEILEKKKILLKKTIELHIIEHEKPKHNHDSIILKLEIYQP